MFRWIKMYWLFLRNKTETINYIEKYETSIKFFPFILWVLYSIINIIFSQLIPNSIILKIFIFIIDIVLIVNSFICGKIIKINKDIIEQRENEKERDILEAQARKLLKNIANLMQQLNYPYDSINNIYKDYTTKINFCTNYCSENNYNFSGLNSMIFELEDITMRLNNELNEKNNEIRYKEYKQWRKTHSKCDTYGEAMDWCEFEARYEEEQKYNQESDQYYKQDNSYYGNSLSSKEKYLKTLELPINTIDFNIIKSQWHKLMKKYHPDIIHDNGEKAKEINIAYQGLKEIYN